MEAVPVEAAGGLLWRPHSGHAGGTGLEIALVHRPKYDDWSLPKGKLDPGEHPLLGALREVREETGAVAVPGRLLGATSYVKDGAPKRVRYWAMRHVGGEFLPSAEVDRLRWLPSGEAAAALAPDRDAQLLGSFLADHRETRAVVVVRHASAGDRVAWQGRDDERPLDEAGRAQAAGLAAVLAAYGVTRTHSAGVLRCRDTLEPFATAAGLTVETEPLLSETGHAADPEAAADRVSAIAASPGTPVICTQRRALPGLVADLCARLGGSADGLQPVPKGALVVLHLTAVGPARLVAVEQLPAASSVVDRRRGG